MQNENRFEILCVTMNQSDFAKIEEMNIHSNVVLANQCDKTSYNEKEFDGHLAKMISTTTRGVGINRNLALSYASADICLLADDDITYYEGLEENILAEFEAHPDADVIIFHLDTDVEERTLEKYKRTRKVRKFDRKPWGAVRVAFRLSSVQKANVWFSTLFGGGAKYPCGEDSIWIEETFQKGLVYYVSNKTIGLVSCKESTWFTGYDEKRYFAAGALYAYLYPKTFYLWKLYFVIRTLGYGKLKVCEKMNWFSHGRKSYYKSSTFEEFKIDFEGEEK